MIYNIVIVANEDYMQHAAVMLCSLFETNKNKQFHIYLFTDSITSTSYDRLSNLCRKCNSKLNLVFPEKELGMSLGVNLKELPVGQWNTMMYYKLFIPVMLPKECERCLFLDVDMVINDDIQSLYNWNLQGNIIAAAEDIPDCDETHKPRLGMLQSDLYINSGVMVCDLKSWRKKESETPIFNYVKQVSNIIMNEQDVIAMYFKGFLTLLPIRWNMTTFYFMRVPKIFDKYLPDLADAKKNPGIIHFACPIKPWFRDCTHPYRGKYKKYLKITAWKESQFPFWEKLTKRQRVNKFIKNILNEMNILKDSMYTKRI
ncbi:glycosyltransferase family 8 protein [Prevotella sp. RM4]|uniref:glycosyltransferase family 8 protein n=1 Tax=Prevotella sp. RM4 TaxID=1200547 RepID=UPI00051BB139|nr:glycosyltransferase family 8 protein [Prevotella sp. RM4]